MYPCYIIILSLDQGSEMRVSLHPDSKIAPIWGQTVIVYLKAK